MKTEADAHMFSFIYKVHVNVYYMHRLNIGYAGIHIFQSSCMKNLFL